MARKESSPATVRSFNFTDRTILALFRLSRRGSVTGAGVEGPGVLDRLEGLSLGVEIGLGGAGRIWARSFGQ